MLNKGKQLHSSDIIKPCNEIAIKWRLITMKVKKILIEEKQVGDIGHQFRNISELLNFLTLHSDAGVDSVQNIGRMNNKKYFKLISSSNGNIEICTSRDLLSHAKLGINANELDSTSSRSKWKFGVILDGTSISNRYKISPFSYNSKSYFDKEHHKINTILKKLEKTGHITDKEREELENNRNKIDKDIDYKRRLESGINGIHSLSKLRDGRHVLQLTNKGSFTISENLFNALKWLVNSLPESTLETLKVFIFENDETTDFTPQIICNYANYDKMPQKLNLGTTDINADNFEYFVEFSGIGGGLKFSEKSKWGIGKNSNHKQGAKITDNSTLISKDGDIYKTMVYVINDIVNNTHAYEREERIHPNKKDIKVSNKSVSSTFYKIYPYEVLGLVIPKSIKDLLISPDKFSDYEKAKLCYMYYYDGTRDFESFKHMTTPNSKGETFDDIYNDFLSKLNLLSKKIKIDKLTNMYILTYNDISQQDRDYKPNSDYSNIFGKTKDLSTNKTSIYRITDKKRKDIRNKYIIKK